MPRRARAFHPSKSQTDADDERDARWHPPLRAYTSTRARVWVVAASHVSMSDATYLVGDRGAGGLLGGGLLGGGLSSGRHCCCGWLLVVVTKVTKCGGVGWWKWWTEARACMSSGGRW